MQRGRASPLYDHFTCLHPTVRDRRDYGAADAARTVCTLVSPLTVIRCVHNYSDKGAEYCNERVCVCVCVCVCLPAIISPELHIRSSPKLLCMLPMAVA